MRRMHLANAKPESPRKLKKKASSTIKEEATDEVEETKILLEVTSPRKNPKRSISEPAHSEPETTQTSPPKKETEDVGNISESEDIGKVEEPETSGNVQDSVAAINVQKSSGPAQGEENILSPVKSEGEMPTTSDGSGTPGSSPEKKKRKYVRKIPLEEVLLKKKKNRMIKLGLIGDGGTASNKTESSLTGNALGSPTKKKKGQVAKSEPVKIAPVMSDLKLAQVSDIVMKPALAIKTASPVNMTKNKDVLDGGTVTLITVFPQSKPSIINTPIIQIVNDKPINISPKKTKQDSPPQKTVKQSLKKDSNASAAESPTAKVKTPRKSSVQKSPCKAKTKSPKTDASLSDHAETDSVEKATRKTPKKNKRGTAMENSCADTGNVPTEVKTQNKTSSKKTEISSTCTDSNTESTNTSKGKTTPKKTPVKVKVTPKKGQPESGCSKKGAPETCNIKKTPTKCKKADKIGSVKQNEQVSETDKTSPSGKSQPKKRRSGLNSSLLCEEDTDFLLESDDSEEVLSRKRPKPRLKCVIEKPPVNKVAEFGSESDISR
ncbi:muscle M-line assembly protein unc-89-like [Haliotis rubra]|uniref:muscle M-line assembly protein unc-89-like n=1 Tax=Haliotis rubra TaxID=36100 RepID=UPI001EE61AE3|nr:muscle M-line assembly protein unc-89-like [Haliotis rubra]